VLTGVDSAFLRKENRVLDMRVKCAACASIIRVLSLICHLLMRFGLSVRNAERMLTCFLKIETAALLRWRPIRVPSPAAHQCDWSSIRLVD
jgi:hypothetical protein